MAAQGPTVDTDPSRKVLAEPEPHFRERFERLRDLLERIVSADGPLHHLGQCTDGLLDFVVNVDAPATGGPTSSRNVGELKRIDQKLSFSLAQLDRLVTPALTGNLIRLLAQVPAVTFICDSVVPGVHVCGVLFSAAEDPRPERPAEHAADLALTRLVKDLRKRLALRSLDPGGFEPAEAERGEPADPSVVGDQNHRWFSACRQLLSVADVHYLAVHRHGQMLFAADVFAAESLADCFTFATPAQRRRFYRDLGLQFDVIAGDLGRTLDPVATGVPTRLVLAVEQGAVYYTVINPDEYLVGVTLKQHRVPEADRRIQDMVATGGGESGRSAG